MLQLLWRFIFVACFTISSFFFFNDTATTEIYTLSLHDALPIWNPWRPPSRTCGRPAWRPTRTPSSSCAPGSTSWRRCRSTRSEEHTSELQSRRDLVCRLLLEKKKKKKELDIAKKNSRMMQDARR